MTPAFRCKKDYLALGAKKGDVIKMSPASVSELDADEKFKGWKGHFVELTEEEEKLALFGEDK